MFAGFVVFTVFPEYPGFLKKEKIPQCRVKSQCETLLMQGGVRRPRFVLPTSDSSVKREAVGRPAFLRGVFTPLINCGFN